MDDDFEWRTYREKLRVVAWWWTQQQGICCICKDPDLPMEPYARRYSHNPIEATIEHLIPRRDNGPNTVGNVRLAHGACNHAMGQLWEANRYNTIVGRPLITEAHALAGARERMRQFLERRSFGEGLLADEMRAEIEMRRRKAAAQAEWFKQPVAVVEHLPFEVISPPRPAKPRKPPDVKWSLQKSIGVPRGATLPGYVPVDDPPPVARAIAPSRAQFFDRKEPPVAKTKRNKPVCSECGSDDITMDGLLRWDIHRQAWVAASELDNTDCNVCCKEVKIEWRAVIPNAPNSRVTSS